jgi:hypothetical protein
MSALMKLKRFWRVILIFVLWKKGTARVKMYILPLAKLKVEGTSLFSLFTRKAGLHLFGYDGPFSACQKVANFVQYGEPFH